MKNFFTLSLLSLALAACGGSGSDASTTNQNTNDSSTTTGNNNPKNRVATYTEFGDYQLSTTTVNGVSTNDANNYLGRKDYTFGAASFSQTTSTVFGVKNNGISDEVEYFAKDFYLKGDLYSTPSIKITAIEATNPTITFNLTDPVTKKTITDKLTFRKLDISGKNIADKATHDKYFEHSVLGDVKESMVYPTGSVCLNAQKSERSESYYETNRQTAYTSLEQWQSYKPSVTTRLDDIQVGSNNEYTVRAITIPSPTGSDQFYAMLKDGKVIELNKYTSESHNDSECHLFNQTAADKMANFLKAMYAP